jgi:hypothetical protein
MEPPVRETPTVSVPRVVHNLPPTLAATKRKTSTVANAGARSSSSHMDAETPINPKQWDEQRKYRDHATIRKSRGGIGKARGNSNTRCDVEGVSSKEGE